MPVIPLYCLACYVMAQDWVLYVCLHYLQSGSRFDTGGLEFTNNYAFNPGMVNMPRDDFTVEFWAKTPEYRDRTSGNSFQSFFSYATHTEGLHM